MESIEKGMSGPGQKWAKWDEKSGFITRMVCGGGSGCLIKHN